MPEDIPILEADIIMNTRKVVNLMYLTVAPSSS